MESQLQFPISPSEVLSELYEQDPAQWLEVTVSLFRQNSLAEVDWVHLIEELESLGRQDRNRVAYLLEQLIRHCLLLQYWQEERGRNGNHWRAEIQSFRTQLRRCLTTTLKNYLEEELPQIYQGALGYVQEKTGHGVDFPLTCPYSLQQLLESSPPN
ncbi:sll1749 [Synechocystis sp. PCC 6803]|uniref:Sll1749 protein n=1 Tax=Synechocystis sp. (strain ATCC 27184 / PCC 6803 / Kazusa) TaxID=1111708 RepID=P73062_SYNY3|nr:MULTISPECIES: DUF29 domain-containing protein [unclassified Synechocystis]BAM50799.1 hypothetical protein BEST7613_1868 [Synechocystis sp. PCC 6803] [Bacillus subtilis BEST7613]AGF50774.1 hypothetical protein MYO_15140 [Synechocystis sp. PCC 6803]ALJ66825.1 hypothetical protein AOY38_02610 [Synechocystis sp. PCC 6803]AVP88671.1 DUF29 domain-containing protein [Synechocystis sp. IPPAS B-1465]MBD2618350.1 DUF29 domain-containing protein [Synechocystis sp. FACHB-898]